VPAKVLHVTVLGPVVRVELAIGDQLLEAETTRQRHAELQLAPGQTVHIWPRQARFFLKDGWPEGRGFDLGEELMHGGAGI